MTAEAIDEALVGTFPASDPPAWTPGIVRPAPWIGKTPADGYTVNDHMIDVRTDVIDLSRSPHSARTGAQAVASLIGAIGLALAVPLAIVAAGTLVMLGMRGVLAAAAGLLALIR
jgi:hypothetical protein